MSIIVDLIPLLLPPTSLLFIISTLYFNISSNILIPAWVSVGINYGQIVGYLPHPEDVKPLLKSIGATRIKIYHADPCVLKEFANSGLEFIVGLGNKYMAKIRDPKQALSWVKSNVQSYLSSTKITSIVIGNEVLTLNDSILSSNLLQANRKLHGALVSFKCKLAGEEGLFEMFIVIGGVWQWHSPIYDRQTDTDFSILGQGQIIYMGNCLIGGMGDGDKSAVIKVTTLNGGVMEFHTPVTGESITDEFPDHGIFQTYDLFWKPLPHSQLLTTGESYHLLPLLSNIVTSGSTGSKAARLGHVRSNSAPDHPDAAAPYRMSFHSPAGFTKKSAAVRGFWKVKLVISPEQLMEILGEEEKTEELIESVRTVGKCGSCVNGSDEWSFCSSRNAASKSNSNKDASLLLDL